MRKAAAVVFAISLWVSCWGQSANSDKNEPGRFKWDWRSARELPYGKRVKNSHELATQERTQLVNAIAKEFRRQGIEGSSQKAALNARLMFTDLNGDGIPEAIVQAFGWNQGCGATGNCEFLILEKSETRYALLLATNGGIQLFTLGPSSSNGFLDVAVASSEESEGRTIYLYRFRSGSYHQHSCYVSNWYTTDGTFRKRKEPLQTRVRC